MAKEACSPFDLLMNTTGTLPLLLSETMSGLPSPLKSPTATWNAAVLVRSFIELLLLNCMKLGMKLNASALLI